MNNYSRMLVRYLRATLNRCTPIFHTSIPWSFSQLSLSTCVFWFTVVTRRHSNWFRDWLNDYVSGVFRIAWKVSQILDRELQMSRIVEFQNLEETIQRFYWTLNRREKKTINAFQFISKTSLKCENISFLEIYKRKVSVAFILN